MFCIPGEFEINACFMLQAKIMFVSVTLNFAKSFVIDVQMSKKIT